MCACISGHLECARALIDANAVVDKVNYNGNTALMWACYSGQHEFAQASIDAGAAVDKVDNDGNTALMIAVESPSLDEIREECDAEGDVDVDSDEDSDLDEEEFEQRSEERFQQRFERKLEERRQGKALCVQALLEAMAPIRGADFRDLAASFKYACGRLQVIGDVLATSHVIEHASVLVEARVGTLTADAQDIIIDFARAVFGS